MGTRTLAPVRPWAHGLLPPCAPCGLESLAPWISQPLGSWAPGHLGGWPLGPLSHCPPAPLSPRASESWALGPVGAWASRRLQSNSFVPSLPFEVDGIITHLNLIILIPLLLSSSFHLQTNLTAQWSQTSSGPESPSRLLYPLSSFPHASDTSSLLPRPSSVASFFSCVTR